MSFLDILSQKGILDNNKVITIEKEASDSEKTVDEVLLDLGVKEEDIVSAKEEYFKIPYRKINGKDIPISTLEKVPEKSAEFYKFVPIGINEEGFLEIGTLDPDNIEARDALQFISSKNNLPFKLFIISFSDFKDVLDGYKGLHGEVTKALGELETEMDTEEGLGKNQDEDISGTKGKLDTKIIEEAPVTKIVATILRYAVDGSASDIHIEHVGDKVRVRFRVDGELHTNLVLPVAVHSAIVARIKVLSNMKLDEKRKPQDNRFSARIEGRKVDFRVSTFPAYYGEKIVMRILESEKGIKGLEDTGLSPENLKKMRDAIKRPYGIILISGPTGSGKSTTLYSLLQEVDRETKNVLSLEDPVEFNIEGVSQSQVRPEIGYTFASGLRTTLRQDPDIIMVGEIRDKETAGLAVQAALTGHLVLSTIHTNDATGVIPRLLDMGVDPFLIAPTLVLAAAQRLVKTLCPNSGEAILVEGSIKTMIDKEFSSLPEEIRSKIKIPKEVYKASQTPQCPTGTKGRIGVYEVIQMNPEIEAAILANPTSTSIEKVIRQQGVFTMKQDALFKAFERIIPLEEVNKL
jgi:type IV pilus assembly protein PilB